jgi:hypothetical protein
MVLSAKKGSISFIEVQVVLRRTRPQLDSAGEESSHVSICTQNYSLGARGRSHKILLAFFPFFSLFVQRCTFLMLLLLFPPHLSLQSEKERGRREHTIPMVRGGWERDGKRMGLERRRREGRIALRVMAGGGGEWKDGVEWGVKRWLRGRSEEGGER